MRAYTPVTSASPAQTEGDDDPRVTFIGPKGMVIKASGVNKKIQNIAPAKVESARPPRFCEGPFAVGQNAMAGRGQISCHEARGALTAVSARVDDAERVLDPVTILAAILPH